MAMCGLLGSLALAKGVPGAGAGPTCLWHSQVGKPLTWFPKSQPCWQVAPGSPRLGASIQAPPCGALTLRSGQRVVLAHLPCKCLAGADLALLGSVGRCRGCLVPLWLGGEPLRSPGGGSIHRTVTLCPLWRELEGPPAGPSQRAEFSSPWAGLGEAAGPLVFGRQELVTRSEEGGARLRVGEAPPDGRGVQRHLGEWGCSREGGRTVGQAGAGRETRAAPS